MLKKIAGFVLFGALSLSGTVSAAPDLLKAPGPDLSQILGGDEGDACQMRVCLSDPLGSDMEECEDALQKYARLEPHERATFLLKCPEVK